MADSTMTPTIEAAASGRAKCRGCGQRIEKGELRLGEHLPNPFADRGAMTLWFHLRCGAYKRPEILLGALEATSESVPENEGLRAAARFGVEHRRLPRVDGLQLASTGRARCRSCREMIAKDTWRVPLVFYAEGRFEPSGFVHIACSVEYFGTRELLDRATHFAPTLDEAAVRQACEALQAEP